MYEHRLSNQIEIECQCQRLLLDSSTLMSLRVGSLRSLASRISAARFSLPIRGGIVGHQPPPDVSPTKPLILEDDEFWYDGTAHPERVLDDCGTTDYGRVTPLKALASFAASMSLFVIGYAIVDWYDPASKAPVIPRQYPYDNLAVERGLKPKAT